MPDGCSYDPFRKQEPPQPQPGELLWTLRKGTDTQTAELHTHAGGVGPRFLVTRRLSPRRQEQVDPAGGGGLAFRMQLDLDDGEAGATGDYHRLVINDFDEDVRAEAEHTRFARIRGHVSTHANRDSWVERNRWRNRCERN